MNARTRWWLLSGTLAAALACASDEAEQGAADPCAGVNVLSVTEQAEPVRMARLQWRYPRVVDDRGLRDQVGGYRRQLR
jgi:hypothetical protein